MIIGHNKREAIDWIQDQLGPYTPRPVAEDTLRGLLEQKLIRIDEGEILMEQPVEEERLRGIAKVMLDKRMSMSTKAANRRSRRAIVKMTNTFDADNMEEDLAFELSQAESGDNPDLGPST